MAKMWNNNDPRQTVILPPRNGFLTPSPASSNSKPSFSPISETKLGSPAAKRDLFHVIHKVPAGDSPYVRAKHVQLIEKDPGRAISLFWSAINAGDRVDSALKDMAIVMKQLDRSDEAIEAVKSFRHLCRVDSQESLDNVLVELYKRAGRTEEEIEMLERKLKRIEEGSAFSGRRTKTSRSQGKKVHITIHEEKSRLLGNLAWAYLQQNNYKAAEEYYRKALVYEPDKNKQCNLAICLMRMNRLAEAKSVLRGVKNSCGANLMDESFARSFERAWEMLVELDPSAKTEVQRSNIPRREEETRDEFYCGNNFENKSKSCEDISALEGMNRKYLQPQPVTVDQLKSGFLGKRRAERDTVTSWRRNTEPQPNSSSWHRKERSSPSPFTQPRRCLWRSGTEDPKTRSYSSDDDDWRKKRSSSDMGDFSRNTLTDEEKCPSSNTSFGSSSSVCNTNINSKKKKSWADMAEEEEEENGEFDFFESPCLQTQMKMENNENVNCNVDEDHHRLQTQMRVVARNLERCGLSNASPKSQPLSVRRSLFFEQDKGKNITLLRRNRLKVFEDITQSP